MNPKTYWVFFLCGLLVLSMIPVYTDDPQPRTNMRTGLTRINDLGNNMDWDFGNNEDFLQALEMAAHSLWLADQDKNWDNENPQKPKGPLEKAFILGAIDEALEIMGKMKGQRLAGADNVNATFQNWIQEIIDELEKAKKELEKNFYETPQHLKDALNDIVTEWTNSGKASSKAKKAGRDAAENLCQWDEHRQPDPGATPSPPWTPPKQNGKPVPTEVGGQPVRTPKKRLIIDLDELIKDINRKHWREFRKLPKQLREKINQETDADNAIKMVKALRAIARLLGIQLKPVNPQKHIYVYASPSGGWRTFPGGNPVSTGSSDTDIETVILDTGGQDLQVNFVMAGEIEKDIGKEISILIDRDSNPDTGAEEDIYSGLGVDISVGLYCTESSPAEWHLQIWEVINNEWVLQNELDSSLFEVSGTEVEFTVPDFRNTLGINHFFSWIGMAYAHGTADVAPQEFAVSFVEVLPQEFSLVAQGVDYELNEDFSHQFAEYTSETENSFTVVLGGPSITEGSWREHGIFFMKDEGGYYTRIMHQEEYTCVYGQEDYCVIVFEISKESITVNVAGITRFGTRAGLHWLTEHWDIVAPSEKDILVLILMWTDENQNGTADPDETAEIAVISPE
jgi:hypothetical protein